MLRTSYSLPINTYSTLPKLSSDEFTKNTISKILTILEPKLDTLINSFIFDEESTSDNFISFITDLLYQCIYLDKQTAPYFEQKQNDIEFKYLFLDQFINMACNRLHSLEINNCNNSFTSNLFLIYRTELNRLSPIQILFKLFDKTR